MMPLVGCCTNSASGGGRMSDSHASRVSLTQREHRSVVALLPPPSISGEDSAPLPCKSQIANRKRLELLPPCSDSGHHAVRDLQRDLQGLETRGHDGLRPEDRL